MQRTSAEYTITVKVLDIMNTSNETKPDIDSMITEEGRKLIKKYLNGKLFDPENNVIKEQIKITEKGL
jgi:predicted transcriptional regulator